MTVDERELEDRLRTSLQEWAAEAPRPSAAWTQAPKRPWWFDRRVWATRLAPALVAAVVVAALVSVAARDDRAPLQVAGRPDVVVADIPVGQLHGVRVLSPGEDAVFVASENDRRLYRIDAATNTVTGGIELAVADAVSVGDGGVFVILEGPRLARLDPVTLEITEQAPLPDGAQAVSFIGGRVWVPAGETLLRFEPATLAAADPVPWVMGPGFNAEGGAGVWRTDLDSGQVRRLDPATGEVLLVVGLPGEPRAIAVGEDSVWVSDVANDQVWRLDPEDGSIEATIPVGRFPHALAVGEGRLWVTNFDDGTLTEIDTATNLPATTVPIGYRPGSVVLFDGSLWVSVHREAKVVRLDPRALASASLTPIDPEDHSVDLRGRDLFLRCMGSGSPTVLLEAGEFAWSGEWLFVQYGLQTVTRVCAYDRAGLGRSDEGPQPRTAARIVSDLETALGRAGITGPYLLVGNAHGGLFSRLFAATHAGEVGGMVLVDAMTPTFIEEVLPLLTPEQVAGFEESFRTEPELQGARESFAQVAASASLGDLPLLVIARDPATGPLAPDAEALWQRHQHDLVGLSTRGRFVQAAGSGFSIPLYDPTVIVNAVRDLIDQTS